MKNTYYFRFALLLLTILIPSAISFAQTIDESSKESVLQSENTFWASYNTCNFAAMDPIIADDVEFYHDLGGVTLGKTALIDSIRKNLCSNPNFHTRREAIPESISIDLLRSSNKTYGAIVSGEHYFFNSHDGKPEKKEGFAKFTTLWLLKEGSWKMYRVLSYGHRAAE